MCVCTISIQCKYVLYCMLIIWVYLCILVRVGKSYIYTYICVYIYTRMYINVCYYVCIYVHKYTVCINYNMYTYIFCMRQGHRIYIYG